MSAFGGLILTNVGRNLQAKAQAGTQLNFSRIAIGDGDLGGASILDLTALKHSIKSLAITKLKPLTGGKAVVGTNFSNQDIAVGFYWKELGVFANDPDLGEILYCYGNAGANAEYIATGGGPDILEKSIDVVTIVGNATSVSATIDSSLIYVSIQDLNDHIQDLDNPHQVSVAQIGAETPTGAQTKATTAETNARTYADTKDTAHLAASDPHTQYALDTDLAGHLADYASLTSDGHVELATAAETTAGTDATRAVTPAGLKVELDKKALAIVKGTSTIPITGWTTTTGDYVKRYAQTISGVVATDVVDVVIDKDYHDIAQKAELCPTCESYAGGVYFYAKIVPTASIPISYIVFK